KCFDNRRKAVTRLCMGGGDSQHTGSVVGKEIRQPTNVAALVENALSDGQQCLAWLGHTQQALAATDKNLNAYLPLQLADTSADARLRGVKHIGDFGQVVIPPGRLTNNFKLLEIHNS